MKRDKQPYDIDSFYTYGGSGSSSTSQRYRINDETLNLCAVLVASKQIPDYKTTADIVRDAVFHRLHYVQERLEDPEFKSKFDYIRNLIETDEEFQVMKSLDRFISECQDLLSTYRHYPTETNRVLERMSKVASDQHTPANKRDEIQKIIDRTI